MQKIADYIKGAIAITAIFLLLCFLKFYEILTGRKGGLNEGIHKGCD